MNCAVIDRDNVAKMILSLTIIFCRAAASLCRGTTASANQLPLSSIVSGAISSELPLPLPFYLAMVLFHLSNPILTNRLSVVVRNLGLHLRNE